MIRMRRSTEKKKKNTYTLDQNPSKIYANEQLEFAKKEILFLRNIYMQPEILKQVSNKLYIMKACKM